MFKKAQYVALGSVILLTLIALNLPRGGSGWLKRAVGGLFTPLSSAVNTTQTLAQKGVVAIVPRSVLLQENENFRRENQELRIRLTQADQTTRENARLRQLLAWQKLTPWKLKLANVVLRDPANWWLTIQIDLGSRDGIRENAPVLTPDGLIGRVSSVSLTRSQVILIGDPACKVAAVVDNEARDHGVILTSASTLDSSLLQLSYLSRNAVVTPGQHVFTSGLGGVFPRGIPIGKIVDSRPVEFGLYTEARVKLSANLSSLEEVWVLLP